MPKRKDTRVLRALRKYWPGVTRVVDAKHKLPINVSSADIEGAEPQNAAKCVMAKACQREQEVDAVLVFPTRAYVLQGTLATRFVVPESTVREIVVLDRGGTAAAGRYFFAPPPPDARIGAGRAGGRLARRGTRKSPIHLRTEGIRAGLL